MPDQPNRPGNRSIAQLRSRPLGKHSSEPMRIIDYIKEWGGVATLLIAIMYTFPFEAIDRYVRWNEHAVLDSRKILSDVASLRVDQTIKTPTLTDHTSREFTVNNYKRRIFSLVSSNIKTFEAAKNQLTYSELLEIASSLAISDLIPNSREFYDAAIKKARDENPIELVNIFHDEGSNLFKASPYQDLDKARDLYRQSLQVLTYQAISYELDPVLPTYLIYLSELAIFEMKEGNLQCAININEKINRLFKTVGLKLTKSVNKMDEMYNSYEDNFKLAQVVRRASALAPRQSECTYTVPELEVLDVERSGQ